MIECLHRQLNQQEIGRLVAVSGLGARAFGSAAAGDPNFIEGLLCGAGARLRLDTVDTVLGFMGEAPLGPLFACEVEAYLSITGTPAQRLGLGAVGEASCRC